MAKYKLLIVESPYKAKTIQKYLGSEFKVTASAGHIMDLPKKEIGIDTKTFQIKLATMEGKEDTILNLKNLIKDASVVYLALDDDREGEAIAFHVKTLIPNGMPYHRVLFNAITKPVIEKAIDNPLVLNEDTYKAQKSRRIIDRLMGYKISPILSRKIKNGLSAGRVQSAVLRLVLEREEKIRDFVSENWYSIQLFLKTDDKIEFKANYFGENKDQKKVIEDKKIAEAIREKIKGKDVSINSVITEDKAKNPVAPFTTSKLQQESNSKLKFPAKKTMEIAQKLYEGIDISGHGRSGLITYMRTDSKRIDPEYLKQAREYIKTTYGEKFLSENTIEYEKLNKKKDETVQDAHEAIRPTNLEFSPEKIKDSLNEEQFLLYRLIWNKFISSQMSPSIYSETTIFLEVEGHFFKAMTKSLVFKGYQAANADKKKKQSTRKKGDEIVEESSLPELQENSSLKQSKESALRENLTQAPSRYNEAGLIYEMEKKGIGRPATYEATLSGLKNRKYVKMLKNRFHISDIGEVVAHLLIKHFKQEMKINYTAAIEKDLDLIANGKLEFTKFLTKFWEDFSKTLETAQKEMLNLKISRIPLGVKCEECDTGEYQTRWGKNGMFLSCNNYPECKSTKNLQWDDDYTIKVMEGVYLSQNKILKKHKDPCKKCGGEVGLMVGKFGKFYSCLNYPQCDFKMPFTLDIPCPQCEKGYLAQKNYNNNTFYGCSNYPNCKFTLNKKPIKTTCAKCKYKVLTLENEDKEKAELKCPSCKQNYFVKKNKNKEKK